MHAHSLSLDVADQKSAQTNDLTGITSTGYSVSTIEECAALCDAGACTAIEFSASQSSTSGPAWYWCGIYVCYYDPCYCHASYTVSSSLSASGWVSCLRESDAPL